MPALHCTDAMKSDPNKCIVEVGITDHGLHQVTVQLSHAGQHKGAVGVPHKCSLGPLVALHDLCNDLAHHIGALGLHAQAHGHVATLHQHHVPTTEVGHHLVDEVQVGRLCSSNHNRDLIDSWECA